MVKPESTSWIDAFSAVIVGQKKADNVKHMSAYCFMYAASRVQGALRRRTTLDTTVYPLGLFCQAKKGTCIQSRVASG